MKNGETSGVVRTSRRVPMAGLLVIVALFAFSCRRPAAPPPPPPPEAAAPPPAAAPTVTLTATPTAINAGQSATLQWQSANATSVQIEPGLGTVGASGNQAVTPGASVTYTATATGPGGTATDTVRVTVNEPVTAAPTPSTPAPTIEELFRTNVQTILFDYDRSDIRADMVGRAQAAATFLQQNPTLRITVSGHADERGSQEYNIGLGDRRANSVRQFLVERGVAESRINTVSFGEERPTCMQATEACYAQNRRAEFELRP